MPMSFNKANDEKLLALAHDAKMTGAHVELVTKEDGGHGYTDLHRVLTITWDTHNTDTRLLTRKKTDDAAVPPEA